MKKNIISKLFIGLFLSLIMIAFSLSLYIGAQNSGEFGESLGGAIIFTLMLVVMLSFGGLCLLSLLIAIIDYAVKRRVRTGIHIIFAIVYYAGCIACGFFVSIFFTEELLHIAFPIAYTVSLLLVMILTTVNLKRGIVESRGF